MDTASIGEWDTVYGQELDTADGQERDGPRLTRAIGTSAAPPATAPEDVIADGPAFEAPPRLICRWQRKSVHHARHPQDRGSGSP